MEKTLSRTTERERPKGYGIQIGYRTLSIRVDERELPQKPKKSKDPADAIAAIDVHLIPSDHVYTRYSCHPTVGLEAAAVQRKLKLDGRNIISSPPTKYWLKALNYVFGGFNFLMWIAFVVTILSYKPLGHPALVFNLGVAMLLMIVIVVSATFYALVDWNASRIMKSIKSLIAEEASVIRDGKPQLIPANEIVVGDIVVLSTGERVPADLRIVQMSSDLKFDRSLLTGESDMVPGSLDSTADNALETRNLALTSTFVTQGTCHGVVFATGDRTVMGRLVSMSGETKFKLTTIQKEIWFFTKVISAIALSLFCLSLLLFGVWLRTSYPGYDTVSTAIVNSIGCLTAFVPQGLPVCVALSLTVIARRMAKRHVLVKNLATIETLGCISVLCSDKTGTLTAGKMAVESVAFLDVAHNARDFIAGSTDAPTSTLVPASTASASQTRSPSPTTSSSSSPAPALHAIAHLCNGAKFASSQDSSTNEKPTPDSEPMVKGDPTDTAILKFATSLSTMESAAREDVGKYAKMFEIPFNSKNKWMMTIVRDTSIAAEVVEVGGTGIEKKEPWQYEQEVIERQEGTWMFVKGAPDILFPACGTVMLSDGSVIPFGQAERERLSAMQSKWSSGGQRVLVLCRKPLPLFKHSLPPSDLEESLYKDLHSLTLVGLIGIRDPPREDVPSAIKVIRRAGVRVFMVTGDFKLTAVAIARQVGIVTQQLIDTIADVRSPALLGKFPPGTVPAPLIKPSPDDPIRSLVLTGEDVASLTPHDWDIILSHYTELVFARTTPDQKMKIVESIKARGDNTVAVTGDGVNDAPALKAADIGVAMGAGSDVAKEAAALVLLNNDFASIPVAIEMGRLVFDNLKKVTLYLMPVGSYTEFMAVLSNVLLGMQIPLSSYLQVCFSITNDVVMSISLMYEKAEADLMLRKPRNARTDRLTDWRLFFQIYLFLGLMAWPCAMSMWFVYMRQQGLGFHDVILVYNKWANGWKGYTLDQLTTFVNRGQCIYYVTMVFIQYGSLLAIRNRRVSLLHSNPLWGPRRNLLVPVCMIGTALIAVVNLYGLGLQTVFSTTPIPGMFWGPPFAFALGILCMDEARKACVRAWPNSLIAKMAW
ncbi:calcium ATPase transmembrane domain M-containing protein [Pisolithus marmoratus]|nr:calcium ATPase transmembrane domain M-containing protein [Pisolithus marmoratus]